MKKIFTILFLLHFFCSPANAEKQIVEYTIVRISTSIPMSTAIRVKKVNSMIEKGWLPLGNLTVATKDALYQAMAKYENIK